MARPPKQSQNLRVFMLIGLIMMAFLLVHMMTHPQDQPEVIEFSEFMRSVKLPETDSNRIVSVKFKNNEITGVRQDQATFKTFGPGTSDSDLRKDLMANGVEIAYSEPEEMSWWKTLLINSLPMLIILFIFFVLIRQLQVGGGKAMSFGKSRAKLLNENHPKITFKDIAGVEEPKHELEEIIDFLRDPKRFTKLGGRIPKGVLLIGPPGTGKTMLAKAIAGEAGAPFFSISGSDFVEMFVGVGASRVRDLFDQAKKHAPCIVFIDEIDAVGRHRGAGLGGGHDEREQTLNQLLVEMDGFESNEGVIIIAATNRSDVLDPALLRPGRFDRRVVVPTPDVKGRAGILKVHTRRSPIADDVQLSKIAQGTPGFSGADLENLVNEAALIAARQDHSEVAMKHFELAKDKVMMGPERRSMIMGEHEKRNTAYHEAGHALVGLVIEGVDPVHKVSIVPRGHALGVTILLPEEDRLTLTKEYAEGMICYAMGGRAAEELMFQRLTTGASDDIEKATDIARKMVCSWGMSDAIGPLSLNKKGGNEVFLGRDLQQPRAFSEKVAEEIDKEIHRIVSTAYAKALKILTDNKTVLENIAETLLVRETLTSDEMLRIKDGEQLLTEDEKKSYRERLSKGPDEGDQTGKNSSDDSSEPDSGLSPVPQAT